MDFGDFPENPFSLHSPPQASVKRRALVPALKFILIVSVCLGVTVWVGGQSRKWLLNQFTKDFDSLGIQEKQTRLMQIADLGEVSIGTLVETMTCKELEVARTSFNLLSESQNSWTVLDKADQRRCHTTLVGALSQVAVQLPDDRTGWATSLLQQTLLATVERSDDDSRKLYRQATQAIELMSLSDRAGQSILSDAPLDPNAPRRLTIRAAPLPVDTAAAMNQWTDWPPEQSPQSTAGRIVARSQPSMDVEPPSVYRSSAGQLQPVESTDAVVLRDINGSTEQTPPETSPEEPEIRSVAHLVDSPMETFDDKSVIHWLGSPHQRLREQARAELVSRGFSESQLVFATQIAAGDTGTKLELVNLIARSTESDPRPWLMLMLDDENRDVKLHVVSALATMNDPDVDQKLRMHLVDETDLTVAARIRRVLAMH
jgi:hypothetical protein